MKDGVVEISFNFPVSSNCLQCLFLISILSQGLHRTVCAAGLSEAVLRHFLWNFGVKSGGPGRYGEPALEALEDYCHSTQTGKKLNVSQMLKCLSQQVVRAPLIFVVILKKWLCFCGYLS